MQPTKVYNKVMPLRIKRKDSASLKKGFSLINHRGTFDNSKA